MAKVSPPMASGALLGEQAGGVAEKLGQVQSLVRAFGVLDVMASAPDGLTLTDIAKRVGLARSTAHRLLTTMESLKYVRFTPETSRWSIGVQAFSVGAAFAEARDLGQLGRPIMRSIMRQSDETVSIGVLRQDAILCLDQVKAHRPTPSPVRPGARLPMHGSASGKAWLAHLEASDLDRWLARTPLRPLTHRGVDHAQTLLDDLAQVRARGFAIDDEELAIGTRCVAAVVFDEHAQPHATLSISGPTGRYSLARLEELGQALSDAARRMTLDIGGRFAPA